MHSSLRSFNFWRVILINLLVSVFVYMLMPLWPSMVEAKHGMPVADCGWTMMLFCIGLFLPGCVSSYLLDKYRRKYVCFWSIVVLVVVSLVATLSLPPLLVAACRLLQGAAFALFHTSLGSTILIDITVSERRDVSAYIYFWICRFAFGIGPAIGVMALRPDMWYYLKYVPIVCAVLAVYFIIRLKLPFRTPLRSKVFSNDRFWLPHCTPLVVLLIPAVMALGVEMAINMNPLFYAYVLLGFVISMVLHFMVFFRADLRAEIVTGLLALLAAFLLLFTQDVEKMVVVAAVLTGYGVGNVTGRLQSFFTVVSDHTERGSAQVTYKLTFESALCIGFFLPCALQGVEARYFYLAMIIMSAISLAFYLLFVHKWFLKHSKR